MNDAYSVNCDYGGIGNFQEGDTACMLCPHEVECSHEAELSELAAIRARRQAQSPWRYPNRSSSGGTRIGMTTTHTSSSLGTRTRSRRPLPLPGESPLARAGKNTLMAMLASGFHELGDFCEMHDLAAVDSQGRVIQPPKKA